MIVILDAGHGIETPGKRSPDGLFREYKFCRELATIVKDKLIAENISTYYICEGVESDTPLRKRCYLVNNICKQHGAKNCICISIHNNAAAGDGKWHNAKGWSVFVGTNASTNSKRLAKDLLIEAKKNSVMGNRSIPSVGYWQQNLAICRDTNCPAVLIENMFQDNRDDVDFLNTENGKEILANIIVDGIKKYIKGF